MDEVTSKDSRSHSGKQTARRYAHLSQDSLILSANIASNIIPFSIMMPKNSKQCSVACS